MIVLISNWVIEVGYVQMVKLCERGFVDLKMGINFLV